MRFKYLFLFSIFFILSSFAYAVDVPVGGVSFYNFSTMTDIWGVSDAINSGTTSTANFPTFGIIGDGSPASSNYNNAPSAVINLTSFNYGTSWSLNMWYYKTSNSTYEQLFRRDNVLSVDFRPGQVARIILGDGGGWDSAVLSNYTPTTGVWTNVVITNNGGTIKFYVNGDERGGGSTTSRTLTGELGVGASPTQTTGIYRINGYVDYVKTFNRTLNSTAVQNLYDYGQITIPFIPPPSIQNDSVEQTDVIRQIGSITINSAVFQTIFSSNFNISINNSELYGAYSFNVLSSANNNIECEFLIDGGNVANVTRSNNVGVLGNVFMMSPVFSLDIGTHTQTFRCRKVGAGGVTISNTIAIGRVLIDEVGEFIPNDSIAGNATVSSGSTFSQIAELNFTISNRSSSNGLFNHLIVEWTSDYTNNAGSDEVLSTFIQINNTNCSIYPRFVSSGSTGSVTGDCLIENATVNATYNIKFFANGTNAVYDNGVLIAKEFILSDIEIAGGQGALVGTNFSGDSDIKLFNITGGNLNHVSTNVFQKQAYSILCNESTNVNMYVVMNNSVNFRTVNMTRDFEPNKIGVLIGHDVLQNVPQDNYSISVWANAGSPSAFCQIVGGAGIGYITDVITSISNNFNLTVRDNFDNGSIGGSFTATLGGGTVFNSVNGWAIISSSNIFENITVSAVNNDYFNATVFNHNTTQDLIVGLNQTLISWNCVEKISGSDLTCFSPSESTIFNYNVVGNPHIQSVNVSGYFERLVSFNVSALQNETLVASGFYSTNLTINSSSNFSVVSNCNYDVVSLDIPSFNEVVSGDPLSSVGLINGSYNITVDCVGFSVQSNTVVINETVQSFNFDLFTINSIRFRFFNITSLDLINDTVNVVLQGSTLTVNSNTSNGTLYVDGLNDDTYTITVTSNGFTKTVLFATVGSNNTQKIDVYMKSGVSKDFIVVDNLGVFQDDVIITFLQNINGTLLTIDQAKTDFSGRSTIFLDETIEYTFFASKSGFLTTTGDVVPTQNEYTVIIFQIASGIPTSIFDDIKYNFPFSYIANNSFAIANLTISSPSGSLQFFSINTTYRSTFFNNSQDAFPNGGVLSLNITNIDPSIESTVTVFYSFKSVNSSIINWNVTYFLPIVQGDDISLTGGLFDDLASLPKTNPIRGLVGYFIVIMLMIIFGIVTRESTPAILGALIGLGICFRFDLLPKPLLIVSIIVSVLLLIADNSRGRG